MTLIYTYLDLNHIVQVADRRLTHEGEVVSDDATKTVFFENRSAWSFTGVSRIGMTPTAAWIADTLASYATVPEALAGLTERLNEEWRSRRWDDGRLAIVVACWGTFGDEARQGVYAVVTNFRVPPGVGGDAGKGVFTWHPYEIKLPGWGLLHVGHAVADSTHQQLRRNIGRCLARAPHVSNIARLIVECVRDISNVDRTVGPDVLVTSLSIAAIEAGASHLISGPVWGQNISFYVPHAPGLNVRAKSAHYVAHGMALTGFGGGVIPPGEDGVVEQERKATARTRPLHVGPDESSVDRSCPHCEFAAGRAGDPARTPGRVVAVVPHDERNTFVNCSSGHLVLLRRRDVAET